LVLGLLKEITSELTAESRGGPIARQRVLEWMRTDDIECMGAIYSLISDHFDRIQPALRFDEYHPFVLAYCRRCLLEDPQGEWADTRYGAGSNVILWFVWSWRDPDQRTTTIPAVKEWLAGLYVAGDAEVRTCGEVAAYFSDWQERPVLSAAYREAMEWVDGGGRSPFWHL
jgi:hypothetical protein